MRVLLTGANGQVGLAIAGFLRKGGHEVIGVVRRPQAALPEGETLIWDLVQPVHQPLPAADIIIHCAATHPTGRDALTINNLVEGNITATRNLTRALKAAPPALFFYISSVSVYGQALTEMLEETTPSFNQTPYGATKQLTECLLLEDKSFPVLVLRLPAIVGPRSQGTLISRIVAAASQKKTLTIQNRDNFFNHCIHVDDLAKCISHLAAGAPRESAIVNVAASNPITVGRLFEIIKERSPHPLETREESVNKPSGVIGTRRLETQFQCTPLGTEETVNRYLDDLDFHR